MTNKFSKKAFGGSGETTEEKPFERDTRDNELFPQIQVKDISTITDENTQMALDSDGIVWKACSSVEELYIIAKHKTENIEVELAGKQQFSGLGKKISVDSWLGVENVKREVKDLPLLSVEDFEIVQYNRLLQSEEKSWEEVQIRIRTKLKNLRNQFEIPKIQMVIGAGKCFREDLDLVKPYKGDRNELRPIFLKRAREWVVEELDSMVAPPNYETDDVVTWLGYESHLQYKKTGIHTYLVCAEDKDAFGTPCLLANYGTHTGKDNPLKGKYKYPQAWLIGDTSKGVGEIDLVAKTKKELKGSGLFWIIAQAFLIGDSADFYNAFKHLPQKTNYADVQAYKDFVDIKTPKELLQLVVDLYADKLPYGVQYISHKGIEMDVPTMEYMNTYFLVAYMTRKQDDPMDFYKLCKAFKVDVSAITDNNKLTPPVRTFIKEAAEENVDLIKDMCENVLPDLVGFKTKKKDLLIEIIEETKANQEKLMLQFEEFYAMVQKEK